MSITQFDEVYKDALKSIDAYKFTSHQAAYIYRRLAQIWDKWLTIEQRKTKLEDLYLYLTDKRIYEFPKSRTLNQKGLDVIFAIYDLYECFCDQFELDCDKEIEDINSGLNRQVKYIY